MLQKISKTQASGDIDDAKYAKTVNTYFLTNDNGDRNNKGLHIAYSADTKFTVSGGKVIAYIEEVSGEKVHAYAYTLKSKNGYYYTDVSDGDDTDVKTRQSDLSSDGSKLAIDTDVDGNIYALNGGYISDLRTAETQQLPDSILRENLI